MVSFADLLREAVRVVFHSPRFLVAFGLPFGLLAFAMTRINESIAPLLPEATLTVSALWSALGTQEHLWVMLIALSITISLVRSLLRGPLFLTAERLIGPLPLKQLPTLKPKTSLRAALWSLVFEVTSWGMNIITAGIITLPIALALRYNPETTPFLAQLGFVIFLVMAVVFFFLKEFAILYNLLAHARFGTAWELGLKLFQKHLFQSLLFGLFLMALSLLFTFAANLAIIASDFIGIGWVRTGAAALSVVIILGASTVIEEVLRLLFFHALAATPKLPVVKVKKLLEEKSPTGAPTI